ncbi:unnamed protein product [Durusdinium trenchii]|uniref:Uncharacterized protein n=1 Tax=Durusdinium trenchii TaxID=1381693 RepID=A0ABP0IEF3_9DINO
MARQKRGLRGFTARGCAGVLFQLMSRCNVMQGKAFSCTSQGQFTTANRKQNNGSTIPQCFSLPGPRVPAELRNGANLIENNLDAVPSSRKVWRSFQLERGGWALRRTHLFNVPSDSEIRRSSCWRYPI